MKGIQTGIFDIIKVDWHAFEPALMENANWVGVHRGLSFDKGVQNIVLIRGGSLYLRWLIVLLT